MFAEWLLFWVTRAGRFFGILFNDSHSGWHGCRQSLAGCNGRKKDSLEESTVP